MFQKYSLQIRLEVLRDPKGTPPNTHRLYSQYKFHLSPTVTVPLRASRRPSVPFPLPSHPYQRKELFAGFVLVEGAAEIAGGGYASLLLHTTHLHAHVLCLNYDHNTLGMQCLLNCLTHLFCKALLQLKAVTEDIHHTGNLAQARHHTVGDVCHMHTSVEREHVMLAKRIEIDVLHYDHLVAALLVEDGTFQYGHRVLPVTSCQVSHGTCHTQRSL